MSDEESRELDFLSPLELFRRKEIVRICAPMVRYSKLPFRTLVRKYGCDLVYTPMIVSESFVLSKKARDVEFTTNNGDRPLVAQFAASNAKNFADAAEIISPFVDAVDLNCGCPQRWAMAEGYGAHLINHPDLVAEMIKQAATRCGLPVSVKMRIHRDLKETIEFVRRVEHAGAAWITVHGRTSKQRAEPANMESVKLVKESVNIPVVANGDIRNEDDISCVHEYTGVDGVMSARGILDNPAMYAGYNHTPLSCVKDWVETALGTGVSFTLFHHHLMFMMDCILPKPEKRVFNTLSSIPAVLDYLDEHYGVHLHTTA